MKIKRKEMRLMEHAVDWYLKRMNIKAKVRIKPIYEPFFMGALQMRSKKKATLWVSPHQNTFSKLSTAFHELTHLHQFVRGDLTDTRWKGRSFKKTPYELQPWEIEAHAVEEILADLYLRENWSE